MERNYTEDDRYYKAKKRVDEIRGFYGNLVAYIAVNGFFVVINLVTSPDKIWFYWPMLGWGIGVLFHGLRVFNRLPFLGKDWEERKMQELMDKENESKRNFK